MTGPRRRGTLTVWNDDRGFGFIEPDGGGQKAFLHISALEKAVRHPKEGDTILYEMTENEGKLRAVNAAIEGVAASHRPSHGRQEGASVGQYLGLGLAVITIAVSVGFFVSRQAQPRSFDDERPQTESVAPIGHTIKGNISVTTGDKLYHLPGMRDYDETIIDSSRGERWFRTEQEAIAAGWRKAPDFGQERP